MRSDIDVGQPLGERKIGRQRLSRRRMGERTVRRTRRMSKTVVMAQMGQKRRKKKAGCRLDDEIRSS